MLLPLNLFMQFLRKKLCFALVIFLTCLAAKVAFALETSSNNINAFNTTKQNFVQKEEESNFYIFASFSLSDNVLRQMIDYAKIYNATIVFKGLENNSFQATSEHIQKIVKEDDEAAIIIDPTLFTKFQINQVPSFILTKEESCAAQMSCSNSYDKLIGSVSAKFALEKFVEKGELSQEAAHILEKRK